MKAKAIFNIIVAGAVVLYTIINWIQVIQSYIINLQFLFGLVLSLLYIFMILSSVKLLRARPDNVERPKLEKVVKIQFVAAIFIVLTYLYILFAAKLFSRDFAGLAFPLAVFYALPVFILQIVALIFLIRSFIISRKRIYP